MRGTESAVLKRWKCPLCVGTFETFAARISKIGPLSDETRAKIREKLQ